MPRLLRSLYVCYLSLEDPLVETQVVAYLEGLARRGHTIHLLTDEPNLTDFGRISLGAGSPGTRSATTSAPRFPPPSTTRWSGPWSAPG